MPDLALFICYRRSDASAEARVVYEALRRRYGRDSLFMDVDSILPGGDWVQGIDEAIGRCDVLLAIIGPEWTGVTDREGKLRLFDAGDRVRLELEAAMRRGVPIIPVLVENASMPRMDELPESLQPLQRHQSLRLDHQTFDSDFGALTKALRTHEKRKKELAATADLAGPPPPDAVALEPVSPAAPPPEPPPALPPLLPPPPTAAEPIVPGPVVASPTSQSAVAPHTRRASLLPIYGAAVLIIAVVAVGGMFALRLGPFGGVASVPTASPFRTVEPTDADRIVSADALALVAHVPADVADSCYEHSDRAAALALLVCGGGDGDILVSYYQYPDLDSLKVALGGWVDSTGGLAPGNCALTEAWPVLDHFEAGSAVHGDALCSDHETGTIFWTDERTNIFGRARTYSGNKVGLYTFWRNEAGPKE